MNPKTAVVFTTIFPPTPALEAWRAHGQLIGVGDKKTPADWAMEGCQFLPHGTGHSLLARFAPDNHYCRKNLGYAEAVRQGFEVIIDTDDDNCPEGLDSTDSTPEWSYPGFDGHYRMTIGAQEFVNAYRFFTDNLIWPRGFPLPHVQSLFNAATTTPQPVKVGIWQALVDGDPDVDAIFRMTRGVGRGFTFESGKPIVLAQGSVCPFNSQNTIIRKELFPLLYLPAVSFRFTDILRGLIAQPIMWQHGYHLGFTEATAVQARNPHDYLKDFESEIPVYLHAEKIHRIVQEVISPKQSMCESLWAAYCALAKAKIVENEETIRLWPWLKLFD